jgi:mRNA interferase HigB
VSRAISRKIPHELWEKHSDAEQPLQAWYFDVKHSEWKNPAHIKSIYRNAGPWETGGFAFFSLTEQD